MNLLKADCVGLWGPDPRQPNRMIPLESRGLSRAYLAETVRLTQDPAVMEFWWSQEMFAIEDVGREHRIPPAQLAALKREGAGGLLSTPVRVDGDMFGSFTVGFRQPHVFDEREQRLLTALAQRAGLAIENAGLHEESEQRRHELEALYEMDQTLHRSLRLDDVLNALVDAAVTLLRGDGAVVWGPDPHLSGRSVPLAFRGVSETYLRETSAINQDPAVRELWWSQASALLVVEDVSSDPRIPAPQRAAVEREGFGSLLNAHVRVGDQVFGTFGIGFRTPHTFSEAEKRLSPRWPSAPDWPSRTPACTRSPSNAGRSWRTSSRRRSAAPLASAGRCAPGAGLTPPPPSCAPTRARWPSGARAATASESRRNAGSVRRRAPWRRRRSRRARCGIASRRRNSSRP